MSRIPGVAVAILWLAARAVSAAEQVIPLPATLDGQAVGTLDASVEDDQLRALQVAPLLDRLRELLAAEYFGRIPTNQAKLIPIPVLESAGIATRFDFQNLSVALSVPIKLRRTQTVNLVGNANLKAVNTYRPAAFSAYMNVRGGVDFVESGAAPRGFDQAQFAIENEFNAHGLVLENETDINPAPGKDWEKRDTRVIYDFPAARVRLTAGDLNYPVAGFQDFVAMLGLSLNRQDSLQPYRITSPLGQSAFFLQSDSKVDVLVNGHVVQSMQMSAGPHQITNFPLTGGANDVILRITDPVGRVEYLNARLFYDPGLLKAGETEFNYAVGFPSVTDPQSPIYRYDFEPAVSAYHRWGVTDRLTAGLNSQATVDTQMGGAEAVFSTLAGTFDFDAAVTHDRSIGAGSAEQLQYHYYAPRRSPFADGQFTLAARYQSPDYLSPAPFTTAVSHDSLWTYQAQYTQRLGERWFAGAGYSAQLNDGATQLATASFIGGYHWGRIYADVTLDHNSGAASHGEWTAFFSLRIDLGRGHNLFSTYDTSTQTSRTEWQYTPADNVETVNSTLGLQHTSSQEEYYGNLNFADRRAEFALNQDALSGGRDQTSVHWGSALVYADGQFGISRPVQDSFALVESAGSLRADGGVGLQPQAQRYQAQEDWLGPAVLPQLTSYYATHVTAEPRRPEADFDPQDGDMLLLPTYHSGTLIRLGRPAALDATLKLTWSDGRPVNCLDGRLTAADGRSWEFISNRQGLVYLSGLAAGKYQAVLTGYPEGAFSVTIPQTSAREIDLGEIKLSIQP